MRIGFLFPAALWLLLLLVPLWALARAVPRGRAPRGLWANLIIRSALLLALVLALAGARAVRDTDALTTVFLVDRSESIAPEMRARADAFVRAAIDAMPAQDRAAVVAFGADAQVERAPLDQAAAPAAPLAPAATGTNIQSAIQLGLGLMPAETNKRMVLLSDGGENAGDARVAAELAASRGIPLSYVDLGGAPGASEALVRELHAPAEARAGQRAELMVVLESSTTQPVHLRILGDDRLLGEQDLTLQPGLTRFPVQVDIAGSGFIRYRAEISAAQDARAENNAADALVRVVGPPRVLLVEGQPGDGQNLKDALAASQLPADLIPPQWLQPDLGLLGAYDVIALINVSADRLPPGVMDTLATYVHDLGKGLVMIGGDQSFGVGGYAQTPLEQALPVSMDVHSTETRPNLAIVYVLDKSSSMQACHCRGPSREKDGYYDHKGRTKLEIGKDAVVRSVAVLDKRDVVGVVAFDGSVHWALQPVAQSQAQPDAVLNAIAPLQPNGHETNIGVGLRAAEDALNQTDAKIKHVILMTDGWSEGEDPIAVVGDMRSKGITVSVVAEGLGSAPFLQQMADAGGGRYFPVKNMEDALQIFVQETRQVSQRFIVEHAFTPEYGMRTPILAGLDQGLPQLYGYDGTTPKQTAAVALADADGAPILAQWQYGLGRSVAWTSDTKGRWAKDWVGWAGFPRFAAQLVGWALPTVAGGPMQVELQPGGAQTSIQVTLPLTSTLARDGLDVRATLLGPGGERREVPLAAQAAGVYRATVDTPPRGTYMLQVSGARGGQVLAQETAALVVPYSPEFRLGQSNPALLEALARVSGGARIDQPAQAFAPVSQGASSARDLSLPLLLVALALLPVDILVRRLAVLWRPRAR